MYLFTHGIHGTHRTRIVKSFTEFIFFTQNYRSMNKTILN